MSLMGNHLGVAPAERTAKDGQSGLVVWFTGLSGAGKSTLAKSVERLLWNRGCRTFLLDGDTLRADLCSDLGFSVEDRQENVRRASIVARLMAEAGLICLAALISPFRADRLQARKRMPAGSFIEVFVNAPLAVCEKRDAKGLYQRARSGELADFTGISSPYEPPDSPEVEIHSDVLTVEDSAILVLKALEKRGCLGCAPHPMEQA
jgi:adenylyl-sulfate kinase